MLVHARAPESSLREYNLKSVGHVAMKPIKTWCLLLFALPSLGLANTSVIGGNTALAAGAQALRWGDFAVGVELTLAGLKVETSRLKRASGFSNLCAGYTALRDFAAAVSACDAALALNDKSWRIFNNRALALVGLGRHHEARLDLLAAAERAPDSPTVARTRAWIDARAPQVLIARETDGRAAAFASPQPRSPVDQD
jgi:tetratricopeptide (TPR) repeat protein